MATALEYFRRFAKEFDGITDDDANAWIDSVPLFVDVSTLSTTERQNAATGLYAAHLAWIEKNQGNGGGVRGGVVNEQDSVSKLSRSYQILKGSDTLLGVSPYGQLFMEMTSAVSLGLMTRFGLDGTL
jgi:hypothetical protein